MWVLALLGLIWISPNYQLDGAHPAHKVVGKNGLRVEMDFSYSMANKPQAAKSNVKDNKLTAGW